MSSGFGHHVRSLRLARGLTQEQLAERCGLAADTIRRLEKDSFSPSLATLLKAAGGMQLQLSTIFCGYELGTRQVDRELVDLVASRPPHEQRLALEVLQGLFAALDRDRAAE